MNEQTFEARFRALAPRLYGTAYLILRSDADAQDAMQEALIRGWRKKETLKDDALFSTWMTRILINESRRILRRAAARPERELTEGIPQREPEDPILRDAIRGLPENYRLPVILYYVEGYSTGEAAKILRLPVTTVKWRLYQARTLLRRTPETAGPFACGHRRADGQAALEKRRLTKTTPRPVFHGRAGRSIMKAKVEGIQNA